MAHPNDELIEGFYAAFARLDGEAMDDCYSPWVRFTDPVFGELRDKEPGAMWRMLLGRAKDLKVTLVEHEADHERGRARWTADYTFSTGRRVHNDVVATFRFEDGWIVRHVDSFPFYAWARQGMGGVGTALGWTPLLRSMVRRKARADLETFMAGETAS
jgi:ketosteroid isomerase-like protein